MYDSVAELQEIEKELQAAEAAGNERQVGFLEGRAFEITREMSEHPEFWDRPCVCGLCQSYAE